MIAAVERRPRSSPAFLGRAGGIASSASGNGSPQFGFGLALDEQRDERANPAAVELSLHAGDGARDDIAGHVGVAFRDSLGGKVDEVLFLLRSHSLIVDYE